MTELKPCPFCGAGTFEIRPNGRMWLGMKYSEPASVSVLHWCEAMPGQPSRVIERVGRDEASAIEAWNRRTQPAQAGQVLTDEEIKTLALEAFDSRWDADDETLVNKYGHGVYLWRFLDFARAIEAAVLAKRVPQWLPIETAPQDWGVTKFDVWANDARFADCWWGKATYEQGEPGIVYQSDYDCNGPVDSYVRNATHWMPLPPPPGIVGEKGGA